MIRWSALLLAAILGYSQDVHAERVEVSTGAAWQGDAGCGFVATPLPAACIVAVQPPSLHPGLAESEGVSTPCGRQVAVELAIQRRAVLISAQVLEKYRAFRESLSTP